MLQMPADTAQFLLFFPALSARKSRPIEIRRLLKCVQSTRSGLRLVVRVRDRPK